MRLFSAKPVWCMRCQAALDEADQILHGRCNKIDLPQVASVGMRVERYAGRCRCCGERSGGKPVRLKLSRVVSFLQRIHSWFRQAQPRSRVPPVIIPSLYWAGLQVASMLYRLLKLAEVIRKPGKGLLDGRSHIDH